jgi:uncharacterized protein YjiS (DUF1127 family)
MRFHSGTLSTPPHSFRRDIPSASRVSILGALHAGWRALLRRSRERRQARVTAAALSHLDVRELRDIGLVRMVDVGVTRYVRVTQRWD